jgi:hypothetical protein
MGIGDFNIGFNTIKKGENKIKKVDSFIIYAKSVNNDLKFPNFNEMKFPIMNG